jgi:hypothetical protein
MVRLFRVPLRVARSHTDIKVTDILDSYPAYSVGSLQALKIASDKEIKMTKSDGQALIKTFVARGYLAESKYVC